MAALDSLQSMIANAAALRSAGRWAEAEHAYMVLLSNEPNLPECWYNLAFVQRQVGRFESAVACYGEALKLGVSKPEEVHLNRSVILSDDLRRPEAAEGELTTALGLNPKYIPALLNLANLREERGDREGASALYERIFALDAEHGEALARSAKLKTAARADDPLIVRLRQAIADARRSAADRASLGFALGKLLDECGAYDAAFAAYTEANRHSRESAGTNAALYDRARHEQFVSELIETFTPARSRVFAPPAANAPIFICGMFRSGSTLVEQVLGRHPAVTPGGEIDFLPRLARSTEFNPFPAAMTKLTPERLAANADWYRRMLSTLFPGAAHVTDKRPDNFLTIGLIKSLFPNAKIVHTTRDPLDNCLSVFFTHLDHSMGYAVALADTAHYYKQYRRLMAHWKSLYGRDILDFDYDAFVRDPRPATERLLRFCDLPWDDACLSFHQAKNAVKTASVWQVREPLYRHASGRWRHYSKHLDEVRATLGEILQGETR